MAYEKEKEYEKKILKILRKEKQGLKITELAKKLDVSYPTIQKYIEKFLERKTLISKKINHENIIKIR